MKARSIIPLVIGLGVGFFAIKMGIDMVRKARGSQGEMNQVVVARHAIDVASRIEESMVTTVGVPRALVPAGAFTDRKKLIGRVVKMTIPASMTINDSMLAPSGTSPGLAAKIPAGHRAVSVTVNEASAVAGFVMPGARVDVFAADRGGRATSFPSRLILADVEVGAVGQSMNELSSDGKTVRMTKSVTLFLKPDQVPLLDAAATRSRIRLALRGQGEERPKGVFWSSLLKKAMAYRPKPVVVAAAPRSHPGHVVTVINGSRIERLTFDSKGHLLGEPSTIVPTASPIDDERENPDREIYE
ncbi:MAG: Flp pilus assembly protein CpaB [Phycisphaerae bacterium]